MQPLRASTRGAVLDWRCIMTIGKTLIAAAVLAITAPVTAALAHDDDYGQHARDHRAHWKFHSEVNEAHRRAHEEGLYSRAEHRAYHRALRDLHGDFQEDHPVTRHVHCTWRLLWRRAECFHGVGDGSECLSSTLNEDQSC